MFTEYGMSTSLGPQRVVSEKHMQESYSSHGQHMGGTSPMATYNQ